MKVTFSSEAQIVLNGFSVDIKTKVDRNNRLFAKVVVPDLDSMVVARVSGPTILGHPSKADEDSIILKAINKALEEFRYMASMAIGREG